MNNQPAIPAEIVADRLANTGPIGHEWLSDGERRRELIWFLQGMKCGYAKFAETVLADFPQKIGTAAMRKISKTSAPYTAAERLQVEKSIALTDKDAERERWRESMNEGELSDVFDDSVDCFPWDPVPDKSHNHAHYYEVCRSHAQEGLPSLLYQYCTNPGASLKDPWYFHGLEDALVQAMDIHAKKTLASIAPTCIVKTVIDTLEFARAEKAMVEITGSSRYGKSKTAEAFCAAYPGRARLVKTPCDNSDRGLLEAIAQALGLTISLTKSPRQIKSTIEHICRVAGFLLVFDEAHFLYPQSYIATTIPKRLNYVRQLLDDGTPVALLKTPQFDGAAAQRFQRKTGWNATQWNARIMRTIILPEDLPEADLLAVVKHQMPGLRDSFAARVVDAALFDLSFMFGVEKIAKNARAEARKNGREEITRENLEDGIRLAGINMPSLEPESPATEAAPRRRIEPGTRSVAPETAKPAELSAPAGRLRGSASAAQLLPAITTNT